MGNIDQVKAKALQTRYGGELRALMGSKRRPTPNHHPFHLNVFAAALSFSKGRLYSSSSALVPALAALNLKTKLPPPPTT